MKALLLSGLVALIGCSKSNGSSIPDGGAHDALVADASVAMQADATTQLDATLNIDATNNADDASVADAATDLSIEASAVALCPVPSMAVTYSGTLPTNPYTTPPTATECVAQKHDVIILLGCPNNANGTPANCQTQRANIAMELSHEGYGDQFIVTGGAIHNEYVEANTLKQLLLDRGVAEDHIIVEPLAAHTDENIYYSTRIMQEHGWQSALIVSQDQGHLIMTAVCDSNCCVKLGKLTVYNFPVAAHFQFAAHYALAPPATLASDFECMHIQQPLKLMCTNIDDRLSCADDFRLDE